jgi:hypothetical protein
MKVFNAIQRALEYQLSPHNATTTTEPIEMHKTHNAHAKTLLLSLIHSPTSTLHFIQITNNHRTINQRRAISMWH